MTSTGSSPGPGVCDRDRAAGRRVRRPGAAGHRGTRGHLPRCGGWLHPGRRRPVRRCAAGSSAPWTGGSTGPATTRTRPWPRSRRGCKTRWTWMRSKMTWPVSCTEPWNPPMCRCGSGNAAEAGFRPLRHRQARHLVRRFTRRFRGNAPPVAVSEMIPVNSCDVGVLEMREGERGAMSPILLGLAVMCSRVLEASCQRPEISGDSGCLPYHAWSAVFVMSAG